MKRLVLTRAYQAVYEALQDAIMSGALPAGQTLPTEAELAVRFGVTRHTVREGIRVLEQSGLVRREAGRRLHVALPRYDDLAPRSSRALLMQKVTFRELWQVALQLEVCATEIAFDQNDSGLLAKLKANLDEMERALEKGQSIIELDIAFHTLIAEATLNRVLLLSREPVTLLFYPALRKLFTHPKTRTTSPRRLVEAHRRLVQAFAERDRDAAREWMRKHIVDFRRGYELAGIDIDDVANLSRELRPRS